MIDVAGRIVTIVGRLVTVPGRLALAEVERRGGRVRGGLSAGTALLVVARKAYRQLIDGRLQDKLDRADATGVPCLGESAFLRGLGLLPPAAPVAGALALTDLAERVGLAPEVVRLLVLFDVLQPQGDDCSFRDLVAAREVARLLAEGMGLVQILEGAERAGEAGTDDQPLARLKLVTDDTGRLARRIGDAFAELDGQLRLAIANPGNPSVDELFEAAEEAEEAGDLATAAELYRRCVALDRRDPIAPFNLAGVLRALGRIGEARLYLERTLASDRGFADAWHHLAVLRDAEGDRVGARACFERAIAADPDWPDPIYDLARLLFELGDYAEAGSLWQRYLTLDPDSDWSRKARHGLALCRQRVQETG